MATNPHSFTVRPATLDNIPSLTTIVPRSFHPTNPYICALVPDTPTIRQWWLEIFTSKLATPETSHLLVAVAATSDNPTETLGVLSMQLLKSGEPGAGFWSTVPPTPDHNLSAYSDIASSISDARSKLMKSNQHFIIELFGVDHSSTGLGWGKKLLLQACSIADEAGLEIFVMANASARGVYMHPEIGFECRDTKVMPGEERYEEFMLVRSVGGRRG